MMWNGDRRQSLRIFALETQKKQQKENQNLNQGKKAGSTSTKDHQTNAAVMSSGNPSPERSKLQLLLGEITYLGASKCRRAKLNGGSYKAPQEFEHDATLVWSNAMLFNDSSTLYYKEARLIRNLATKLFNSLKTDPESFVEISKSGCRGGRRSKYSEVDQRYTYRPLNKLLN
ncbi:putative chromatin remodeler Bromodomain family [Rosa chinensis]|uniref:Putative chromatin remodeler Bromodomain family n=1 Tax=Rosa chinensis TaxID=74649 RepID=A0A2P6SLY0_ROSCH|nr:putative chromatin remodeler Bromodomain family [Rosa chinensis]